MALYTRTLQCMRAARPSVVSAKQCCTLCCVLLWTRACSHLLTPPLIHPIAYNSSRNYTVVKQQQLHHWRGRGGGSDWWDCRRVLFAAAGPGSYACIASCLAPQFYMHNTMLCTTWNIVKHLVSCCCRWLECSRPRQLHPVSATGPCHWPSQTCRGMGGMQIILLQQPVTCDMILSDILCSDWKDNQGTWV